MKKIRLTAHAIDQLVYRGTCEEEIIDAITTSSWQPAELGRLECKKDYPFRNIWNNKYYETKQIRPIFVEEENEIVVITVYTYFY